MSDSNALVSVRKEAIDDELCASKVMSDRVAELMMAAYRAGHDKGVRAGGDMFRPTAYEPGGGE